MHQGKKKKNPLKAQFLDKTLHLKLVLFLAGRSAYIEVRFALWCTVYISSRFCFRSSLFFIKGIRKKELPDFCEKFVSREISLL